MKITCDKIDLAKSVSVAARAVDSKSTMPIMTCLLIDASEKIHITGNSLDFGIETTVPGTVIEPGRMALTAKTLSDIVAKLPDGLVSIETGASITCGKAKFKIPELDGKDFATLPDTGQDGIRIPKIPFVEAVRKTIFAVASDSPNALMKGELFEINQDTLRIAALDGHRIAVRTVKLDKDYGTARVTIPAKAMQEAAKIMSDDATAVLSDKSIMLEFDGTRLFSRLIDDQYFNIDALINEEQNIVVKANRTHLVECIDRAMLFVKEREPVIMNITDCLNISINSCLGSLDEDVEINKNGDDVRIGFNGKYVLEPLKVIEDDTVTLSLTNSKSPCILRGDRYIYLILPVMLR